MTSATNSARTTERHIDEARDETSALTPETVDARKPVVIEHLDAAKTSNAATIDSLADASKRIDTLARERDALATQLVEAKAKASDAERRAHNSRLGTLLALGVIAAGIGGAMTLYERIRWIGLTVAVAGISVAVVSRLLSTIDDWLITGATWGAGVVLVAGAGVGIYLLGRRMDWWESASRLQIDALEDADKLGLDAKAQKASVARKAPPEFHAVVKEQTRPSHA